MDTISIEYTGIDGYIYLTACKYLRAAEYIPQNDRGAPYYVNIAFAIELFIKSLNVTTKTEFQSEHPFAMTSHAQTIHTRVKGHSLLDMFTKLPELIQVHASEVYKESTGLDLKEDLEEVANTFVDWRYLFEKQSISIPVNIIERLAHFFKGFVDLRMKH